MISLQDRFYIQLSKTFKAHGIGRAIMVSNFLPLLIFLNTVKYKEDGFQRHRDLWEVFLPRKKREGCCRYKAYCLHAYEC